MDAPAPAFPCESTADNSLPHDAALRRLVDQVCTAREQQTALDIRGGGTKAFYGGESRGEPLDLRPLAGISSHEPTELVVTVRAGTPLAELEAVLGEQGQCLPFFALDTAGQAPGLALWRLSVPPSAPQLALAGEVFIEWGGQRGTAAFALLSPPLQRMHRTLKTAFDPAGVFNPGRLYADF